MLVAVVLSGAASAHAHSHLWGNVMIFLCACVTSLYMVWFKALVARYRITTVLRSGGTYNTSFDLPSDGSIDFERVAISCSFAANQAAYALALRLREKVTLTGVVDSYDQIGRVLWLKDCRGN